MKLVLKLPKDKPPFIGILFSSSYIAQKTNTELVYYTKDKHTTIIIEPINTYNLQLTIECKEAVTKKVYENVEYNQEKLKSWLVITKGEKLFNFSHLIQDHDKHVVVHAGATMKNFVVKVNEIKIKNEE